MYTNGDAGARRRSTVDLPSKPEAGLAEWTSKIKELQRQVDADEEAETRRLEQEIAASRMARMRRSTGRGTTVDLSTTDVAQSLRQSSNTPAPAEDRDENQAAALKKLTGETRYSPASSHSRDNGPPPKQATSQQPMSLAAFMGGRATGPRMNKPAPQLDSHDPTLFEQRTITAPHPIFGRGGVAMPGMVGKTRVSAVDEHEPPKSAASSPREFKPSSPPESQTTIRSLVKQAEERRKSQAPLKAGPTSTNSTPDIRQRTISTPASASPSPGLGAPTPNTIPSWKREPLHDHSSSQNSVRPLTPRTQSPSHDASKSGRHTPTRSVTPAQPPRVNSVSPLPPSRTPQPVSYSPTPKSPPTNPVLSASKPVQPGHRKSFHSPELPQPQNPPSSYLRSPVSKELTPSISRLQGRGFVQSMVKASSQLETPSHGSTSPSTPPTEKSRDPPRKSSVLDRWQFSDSPPPIIAPKPVPLRKSRTIDPSASNPASPASPTFTPPPKVIKPEYTGKSLKSVASLPSIAQAAAAQVSSRNGHARSEVGDNEQKRGLGSATTMISYIKPLKTGEHTSSHKPPSRPASAAASRSRAASPEVDEMGLRVRSRTQSAGGSEVAQERQPGAATGTPLSHPTKDRARKPRKAKTAVGQTDLRSDPTAEADRKLKASSRSVDEDMVASFDVKNLSIKHASPLEAIVTSSPAGQADEDIVVSGPGRRVHFPLEVPVAPPPRAEKPPVSPVKHVRIPSTGNRATVMDVAQALQEHEVQAKKSPSEHPENPMETTVHSLNEGSDIGATRPDVKPTRDSTAMENSSALTAPPLERRKSSYEKYSAFVMPPLLEEKTPVHSPARSLTRGAARAALPPFTKTDFPHQHPANVDPPSLEASVKPPTVIHDEAQTVQELPKAEEKFIHLQHNDGPLPKIDVAALFHAANEPYTPDADIQTISVETMAIQGSTATVLTQDGHILYDTEVLAVIHRSKVKSSGLVNTKVWAWKGSKADLGEREEKKLQELARRYNTPLVTVQQYSEPPELVYVLGGRLVTRQGLRAHWSSENTAMHVVRSQHGVLYIDELELGIRNLCSGFSYCMSLLETFYVWYGYASTTEERKGALQYAQTLAPSPESIIELVEDESDQDEMFWLIMGEGDYAKADYWRWKPSMASFNPRAWLVRQSEGKPSLIASSLGRTPQMHSSVYILDCIWEIFVLVGSEARGSRQEIRIALSVADELSSIAAPSRPFIPPVHVLVLPSQVPLDLRVTFRDLDESFLNRGSIPDHMNLIPSTLAFEHLQKTSWSRESLQDSEMLPLGLQPTS